MRKIVTAIFFLFLQLFAAFARASSLGEPYETEARTAVRLIREKSTASAGESVAEIYKKAWKKKCVTSRLKVFKGEVKNCVLTECDVAPDSCRPDRTLFFRGEAKSFDEPAVSAMVRSAWSGAQYAENRDASGLLGWLRESFQELEHYWIFKTLEAAPWYFYPDSQVWRTERGFAAADAFPKSRHDRPEWFLPFTFQLHARVGNWPMFFVDPELGKVSVDPFVSFTSRFDKADNYARYSGNMLTVRSRDVGRVVILSVPNSDVNKVGLAEMNEVDNQLPAPGAFLDLSQHVMMYIYKGRRLEIESEKERDVVLYPRPEYVYEVIEYRPTKASGQ